MIWIEKVDREIQGVTPAVPGIPRGREITLGEAYFILPTARPACFMLYSNSLSPSPRILSEF